MSPVIISTLRSKGYKLLGSGADQWAFLEPATGQVLKIFGAADTSRAMSRYSEAQKMAITWIKYCQKNADNPFLPKFSGWSKFVLDRKIYLQIRMEKLGSSNVQWESAISRMGRYTAGAHRLSEYLHIVFKRDPTIQNTPDMDATLVMSLGKDGIQILWQTLRDLREIGKANGWDWDLHSGNVMTRNDGTPVIVDPWYLGEEGSNW